MKLLVIETKIKSTSKREHKELQEIFKKELNINLEIIYIANKNILKQVKVKDGSIIQSSVPFQSGFNWVHVRLSSAEWRKLKLKPTMYGEHQKVKGVSITFGRWTNRMRNKRAPLVAHEFPNISEHVLGMLHEYIHGQEGVIAVAHSYLYGYDRLYTKAQDKKIKPKRYVKQSSLKKALQWVFKKNNVSKFIAQVQAQITPLPKESLFERAVKHVLTFEGGYVNNPKDPGGETKYGISKRAYPKIDIKNLTIQQAKDIYYKDYWLASKCDKMDYKVALLVFDMSVNMGINRSVKTLQEAIGGISVDGLIGNQTLNALNNASDDLYVEVSKKRMKFYIGLKTFKTFGLGWSNRTFDLLKELI